MSGPPLNRRRRLAILTSTFLFLVLAALPVSHARAAETRARVLAVLTVDEVGVVDGLPAAADILSATFFEDTEGRPWLRVGFLSLDADVPGRVLPSRAPIPTTVSLSIRLSPTDPSAATGLLQQVDMRLDGSRFVPAKASGLTHRPDDADAVWLPLPADLVAAASIESPLRLEIETLGGGETVTATFPAAKQYEAHCAFVLHGNQGLGYSDVFVGRYDDLDGSGFDEALQVHESTTVPGNFHLSGTLQSSAEWSANNGDPLDFNAWLAAGVTAGWAGMVTSAYAQHIMPFVLDDMNDWAVGIESAMIDTRYGYTPRVAWVPERVWLNTTGYPSAGVNDWIGDNFEPHGVWGVILDDDVHLAGHDNHRIHTLSGTTLRLIPRDRSFTGNIIGGDGQASLDILTGLAGSGVGPFRIAVFAEDWEAAAEMGIWATVTPNAKETYDWFIGKCNDESAWLHTWKLADAIGNPDFNGDTFTPAPGTYGEIGGGDGYGGGDNGWYTHWAGWIPWANGGDGNGSCRNDGLGNCKNYGTLWNDAYTALVAAPDNDLSQAGWYVLMTNLHETAWHDGLGGAVSGWQHNYSAHMKNAMIYAEAAHWANGEYIETTAAFFGDIDNDGYQELILHNDHLFAVFRGAGGRLTNLFVKGPGYGDTVIGIDNAYWSDTNADYNDANHVGAFSEVSPDYQHDPYDLEIVQGSGSRVHVRLSRAEVTKEIVLETGDQHLDVVYRVGPSTHWIQAGFSPSLVDLVWNAQLDRVWPSGTDYMGQRNPNTGIATAWILGTGGADHQKEFSGTLMKGDEIMGSGVFQAALFAGPTGAPDGSGRIAELEALIPTVTDTIGPAPLLAEYYAASDRLRLVFDQACNTAVVGPTLVGLDEDGDGSAELTLGTGATVVETGGSFILTFALDVPTAAALEALDPAHLLVLLGAGAVQDLSGVDNPTVDETADRAVSFVATQVTIDGHIEQDEWNYYCLPDSNDSAWTAANEIDALYAHWDETYLYLAIDGVVSANSWLLYVDVDPDSASGQTDLTATDAWERGATFTAPGFAADFQYGCYQHQSAFDGDGFWQLLTTTTTQDRSGEILSAFDSFHLYGDAGGSELAVPWNTLYGLGDNAVPVGARLSVVASVCWDPEPGGELGGDSAPSNTAAGLPILDTAWTLDLDADGDGVPDLLQPAAVPAPVRDGLLLHPAVPNPFNPSTTIDFEVPGSGVSPVRLSIFDIRGRLVSTLVDRPLGPGRHSAVWRGCDHSGRPVAAGTYFSRLEHRGRVRTRPLSLIK